MITSFMLLNINFKVLCKPPKPFSLNVLNTFFNQVADAHGVIFQELTYDGGFAVADLSLVVGR